MLEAKAKAFKASIKARSAFSNSNIPPILVYQMGKVGSSTVCRSLETTSLLPNSVLHLHFLSKDLAEHRKVHERAGIFPPPYHIYLGEAVQKTLANRKNFPIKVISLVREPIAFVVSDIFQNPHFASESLQASTGLIDPQRVSAYVEKELRNVNSFAYLYEWFDRELKTVFDIDVFKTSFPVDVGYKSYSEGSVEALIIRLEDLSEKGPKVISEFLDLDDRLVLKRSNIRSESDTRGAYQEVLKRISVDLLLREEIYEHNFVRHFYSETQCVSWLSTLSSFTVTQLRKQLYLISLHTATKCRIAN